MTSKTFTEQFDAALTAYEEAAFACGAWTTDDEEEYETVHAALEQCRTAVLDVLTEQARTAVPTLITDEGVFDETKLERKPVIVEVDEFDGEDSGIEIRGAQTFRGGDGLLYCIGLQGNDGVIRFVDYGYRTPEEAKEAWAEAEYLPGRGA